jgi:glycosyltransferase involved in cell wall biosynthesis
MSRTIVVLEPVCWGLEHTPFNAGLILAGLEIADRIIFLGETTHLNGVREMLGADASVRVDWRPISLAPRDVQTITGRFPGEWRALGIALKACDESDAFALITSGVSEAGLIAIKLKERLVPSRRPMGVVLHSILGHFMTSRTQRRLMSLCVPDNVRFLVLGPGLMQLVQSTEPRLAKKVGFFTHPYSFAFAPHEPSSLDGRAVTFGFLGLATRGKGFAGFLTAAGRLSSPDVHFELVGRVAPDCQPLFEQAQAGSPSGSVLAPVANERLSTSAYHTRLMALSYAVFPYQAEAYRYVRSGAALDAVWAAKPIIGLRIPALQELFDRLGDIGYLCGDYAEMEATMAEVVATKPHGRYAQQSANLIRGREAFGAPAVARELRLALGL